jgi:hypothetical protein
MLRWVGVLLVVLTMAASGGAEETHPVAGSLAVAVKQALVADGYFHLRENTDGKPDTVIFFPNDTVEYEVEYSDCLNQIITRDDLEHRRFRVQGETEQTSDVRKLRIHSFEVIPEKPTAKPGKSGNTVKPAPVSTPASKAADTPVRPKKKK